MDPDAFTLALAVILWGLEFVAIPVWRRRAIAWAERWSARMAERWVDRGD